MSSVNSFFFNYRSIGWFSGTISSTK